MLTGPVPGEYHLSARRTSDGALLGQARFRVTRHWPDPAMGPPVVISGPKQYFLMWGGGPNAAQNIGNNRAPEGWRVAVVFVSTADRRSPADLSAAQATWAERLTGNGRSVRTYYEEVSYRKTPAAPGGPLGTTISLVTPMARLDLGKGWGDYFEQPQGQGHLARLGPQADDVDGHRGGLATCSTAPGRARSPAVRRGGVRVQTASEALTTSAANRPRQYVWPQATAEVPLATPGGPTPWTIEKPIVFMPSRPRARCPPQPR